MAKVNNWEKFKLLLWKNWILQLQHKFQLLLKVILPVLFTILLVPLRRLVVPEPTNVTTYSEQDIFNLTKFREFVDGEPIDRIDKIDVRHVQMRTLLKSLRASTSRSDDDSDGSKGPLMELLYSPSNLYLDGIVRNAAYILNISYAGYPNAMDLVNALMTNDNIAGVQFDDSLANITWYPSKFSFALRFPSILRTGKIYGFTWKTDKLFPQIRLIGPRQINSHDGGVPVGYLREGFLPIQAALSFSFLILAGEDQNYFGTVPNIRMQRYPYPEHIIDHLTRFIGAFMSLIVLLSFIYPCVHITKDIVHEKEKQLKEVMKIMGLDNWIHWLAWFVKSFLILGISVITITVITTVKWNNEVAVLPYSSWSVVLFFLLIYCIASICFCFMIATFFSKASTAAAVTYIVWFITLIPYMIITENYDNYSLGEKLSWSLLSNTALGVGFKVIFDYEVSGEGIQWSNIFTPPSIDDDLSLSAVMLVMLISSLIYMSICLYMEQIFPGEFGVPKKWHFPFTETFRRRKSKPTNVVHNKTEAFERYSRPDAFEIEPPDKRIGVQILLLNKTFGDKTAVNDLSLNIYESEITVLLGHNGAGKTTTISMLTGMIPPTSGTAIINGSDICSNIEEARKSMGICPQHNVLFDDMSVADHIVFFSRLKGLRGHSIQREVNKYLKIIELEKKANKLSRELSGGMKRKLSICCALCGNTKVVLCDEPSSGMDPAARRKLWDLLQAEKIGRTLVITTHFMDEADVLGDRIAIMCGGDLKCHGTSFFLKKKYGSGYHLVCVKREKCNINEVTALLSKYIPSISPKSDIGIELTYQLPDRFAPRYEDMLRDLENNSDRINLSGYGVGMTSMEEVFMRVGAERPLTGASERTKDIHTFSDIEKLLKGHDSNSNQWSAMFLKKFLYTFRNRRLFILQLFVPIYFVVVVLYKHEYHTFKPLPSMTIDLKQYPSAVTVLEVATDVEPNSVEEKIAEMYSSIANTYGKDYIHQSTRGKSFSDYILELGRANQAEINSRYLSAATVANGSFIAWLNNQPYHTAPLTVNMVFNAMAKVFVGDKAEITVTNYPLPYKLEYILEELGTYDSRTAGAQMALNLSFCMCFISAMYVIFIVKERESRSKLLQFVGGVKVWTFWSTQIIFDMITITCPCLVVIITLVCFQAEGYSTFDELGSCFIILVIYGFAGINFSYLISYMFTEPASCFSFISIVNVFCGTALYFLIIVLSIKELKTKDWADKLQRFFRVSPNFCLAMSFNKMYTNNAERSACSKNIVRILPDTLRCQIIPRCCHTTPFFDWDEPGILQEIICMIVSGIIFFLIVILIDLDLGNELIYRIRRKIFKYHPEEKEVDDDVQAEKERILAMTPDQISQQNLVLDRVTKYYGKNLAVNELSLCIKREECFGLLGVNGAGKTTTFKMMTGDERITYGSAYVKGLDINTNKNKVYKEIGYCPQFDALFDDLTGRETLKIFCLLRGIRKDRINKISEELGKCFGFIRHIDKTTKKYSGGSKRKLSTAIAVIGNPTVIYLDEPTTGMDPAARRQLWNIVCDIRDAGKSIVLTSHSMEECEALCTRLAVMVNGELKCIGSTQHLKNKFSKGLILKIKVRRGIKFIREASKASSTSMETRTEENSISTLYENILNVKEFVNHKFPQAKLQEEYQGILTFYIPLSSIKWSKIFGLMENNREKLNIEDYYISQTTLEEIFLDLVKFQREDKRPM